MTFTPNMISASVAVKFTPGPQWVGMIVPVGTTPVSVEDLGGGTVLVHCRIRYDYGPFEDAGNDGASFAFLADRLLVKILPEGGELAYTDRGGALGSMRVGDAPQDVYVYTERGVMCISSPGGDAPDSPSRTYERVADVPFETGTAQ